MPRRQRHRIRVDAEHRNGKLRGTVYVRDGREVVWGRESEDLHDSEDFDLISEVISEWFDKPEDSLREAIDNQVKALEAEDGREDPRPARRAKHDVHARYYIDQLHRQGRFVYAADAILYFDKESKMPVNVKTDRMLDLLVEKFPELNETMPVTK